MFSVSSLHAAHLRSDAIDWHQVNKKISLPAVTTFLAFDGWWLENRGVQHKLNEPKIHTDILKLGTGSNSTNLRAK